MHDLELEDAEIGAGDEGAPVERGVHQMLSPAARGELARRQVGRADPGVHAAVPRQHGEHCVRARAEDHDLAGIMPAAWSSSHDRPAVAGADRRFTFTSPNVLVPGGAVSDIDSRIGCRELRHPILMLFCESGGSGVSRRCRG